MIKQILSIAGSDSGAGAGIQADLKTFAAHKTYGLSVITAITAQNTMGVKKFEEVSIELIKSQLDAVFEDFDISAVKTGMLPSAKIIKLVADYFKRISSPTVVDTVMIAKGGHSLVKDDAVKAIIYDLIPVAFLITPNIDEAEVILDMKINNVEEMKLASEKLLKLNCKAVLLKGGHLEGDKSIDVLYDGEKYSFFEAERINTENTHGTGCTLSSAIAANLGKGLSLEDSVKKAKDYISNAILYASKNKIGHGHGPLNHFYMFED
jgi:hydroxymethylpyrimidine/phosphomethylpyrimidine kinase